MTPLKIPIELTDLEVMPQKASEWSAGYDIRANEEYIIPPGATVLVSTGIRIALPQGFEVQVRPRSGLSVRSRLRVANTPGTVDADYRDEVKVILHNNFSQAEIPQLIAVKSPLLERFGNITSCLTLGEYLQHKNSEENIPEFLKQEIVYLNENGDLWGTEHILKYERIAQIVLAGIEEYDFVLVENVRNLGQNRGGGFGHSGRL